MRLDHGPESLHQARVMIAEAMRSVGSIVPEDDALLVADEIASNALRHGGGSAEISVDASRSSVHVEVRDASSKRPVLHRPGSMDEGGRGLLLVSSIATAWGTRPAAEGGKTVWVDLQVAG